MKLCERLAGIIFKLILLYKDNFKTIVDTANVANNIPHNNRLPVPKREISQLAKGEPSVIPKLENVTYKLFPNLGESSVRDFSLFS